MKKVSLIIVGLIISFNILICVNLPAPLLISPADSCETEQNMIFYFSEVAGAVRYQLILSTDMEFASIDYNFDYIANGFRLRPLEPCSNYFWKIRAIDNNGNPGEWSDRRVILRWTNKKIILNSPKNDSKDISDTTQFSFTVERSINPRVTTRNGMFKIQFDYYYEFNAPLTLPTTYINDSTFCSRFDLPDTKYYWRIKFIGCNDSAFSDVYSFTTKSFPNNFRTYQIYPFNDEHIGNKNVKFIWSYSEMAKAFKLVLFHKGETDTIAIPIHEKNNSELTYYVDSLAADSYYYWHVITETETGYFETGPRPFLTDIYSDVIKDKPDDIIIYPKPASDYIEISCPPSEKRGSGGVSVVIYDILGIEQPTSPQSLSMLGEGVRIDISSLSPGVYFVRVGDVVRKFVKF